MAKRKARKARAATSPTCWSQTPKSVLLTMVMLEREIFK